MAKNAASLIHIHLTYHFAELGTSVGKHCLWVDRRRNSVSILPLTTVSMLLKSCAIPPVR
jgi:hypothetical protein